MAQHDYNLANQSGAALRADLNDALAAIVSNNSGATGPATTFAYQLWADTTAAVLKQRNAANNAWVTLFKLADGAVPSVQTQLATRFTAGGTADAITGTLSPAIASYAVGLRVTATPGGANTVAGPTLNLNSLGTKTIKKRDSGGSKVALVAGDYNASGPFDFEYDGTDFILLNPLFHNVSGLTEDTTPDTANDFALVWDASASAHKKVKLNKIGAAITSGTAIATTSGTAHDFTGIPAGVKKITVTLQGVSTNGASGVGIQIGDSGGVETSGYSGGVYDFASWVNLSVGFFDNTAGATVVREGAFELSLIDAATNTWACTYMVGFSHTGGGRIGMGSKSLSATLDRVRLTSSGGSDAFDAGKVNIVYQ